LVRAPSEHGQHAARFGGVGWFVQEVLVHDHRRIRCDQDLIGRQRASVRGGFLTGKVFGDLRDRHARWRRFVHIGARHFHRQVEAQEQLPPAGRSGGEDQTPIQVHGMKRMSTA
jgi:hypothetical protein